MGTCSTFRSDDASNSEKSVVGVKGETVVLRCEFSVSGWSAVQWLRFQEGNDSAQNSPEVLTGNIVSTNGSTSIAKLTNVSESDEGNYSCVLATLSSGSTSYMFRFAVKDSSSCTENSCSSNGECMETVNGYNCDCEKGFMGTNCELIDPCSQFPCQNGGTCSVDGENFNCTCATGYGGDICDSEVCIPNVCGTGGSCSVKNKKVACTCPYNYAGDRCQHQCRMRNRHSYCSHSIWTCKISENLDETCVCDYYRRYGGNRCMVESDVRNECEDQNICNGRGSCSNYVLGFKCSCNSYASGKNCEFFDECRQGNNLCVTFGGRCVDLTDGYKCVSCPNGQYGDKCQYKKDPCTVTCQTSSMTAVCDTRFFSKKMRTIPTYLNRKTSSCRLPQASGRLRRVTVSYTDCGTEIMYAQDNVVYRNYLRVGYPGKFHDDADSVITRAVGHFTFKMECSLPLVRNASTGLNDLSLLLNETVDLEDRKRVGITGTNIEIYKDNYSQRVSNYIVGDRLYVKMSINADSNPSLSRGYKLYPITCFATPDRNGDGERYTLMENGCILDETFQFERTYYDQPIAYFSFVSFCFKSNLGKLYLHCSSLACMTQRRRSASREECGAACKNDIVSTQSPTTAAQLSTRSTTDGNVISRTPGPNVKILTLQDISYGIYEYYPFSNRFGD